MSKQTGYSFHVCDRNAEHNAYLKDDDPRVSGWHALTRVTADGVSKPFYLCDGCYTEFRKLAIKQDGEFNTFMAGGE